MKPRKQLKVPIPVQTVTEVGHDDNSDDQNDEDLGAEDIIGRWQHRFNEILLLKNNHALLQ